MEVAAFAPEGPGFVQEKVQGDGREVGDEKREVVAEGAVGKRKESEVKDHDRGADGSELDKPNEIYFSASHGGFLGSNTRAVNLFS